VELSPLLDIALGGVTGDGEILELLVGELLKRAGTVIILVEWL